MACCNDCASDNSNGGFCVDTAVANAMQSAKLSGWLDDAIKGGLSLLKGGSSTPKVVCTPPAGCFKCQMIGSGAIAGCLDTSVPAWHNNYNAWKSGSLADAAALGMAQQLLTLYSNNGLFTPQSDSYLTAAKAELQSHISEIQAKISAAAIVAVNPAPVTTTATGTTAVVVPTNLIDTLLNDNLLMYGGIALGVYLLVRR